MADKEEDLEIIVDGGSQAEPEIKVETIPDKKSGGVDDALTSLKAQLEQERQARLAAERQAREAQTIANNAQAETYDSNVSLVTNAIATITQANEILKANYRDALAAGDIDRAVELNAEMTENVVKVRELQQGKQALEQQPRTPQQVYQPDPVEAVASRLSPKSAAWVRAHPEYATDQRMLNKMISAHNIVVDDGIPVDSDAYFAEIESILRVRPREAPVDHADPGAQAAQVTQRRQSPPAAPVSRAPTNNNGQRPNTVRLTAQQVEMAELMGMTTQEYAKNLLALQKEGKIH
jgi:hypothetical protein